MIELSCPFCEEKLKKYRCMKCNFIIKEKNYQKIYEKGWNDAINKMISYFSKKNKKTK